LYYRPIRAGHELKGCFSLVGYTHKRKTILLKAA
jgi:hypothetical protein